MRKLYIFIAAVFCLLSCQSKENEFGRIDQKNDNIPVPRGISEIVKVKPTAGGAVIWVKIPDDENIKGVVGTYERNGETVKAKISRYVDSLEVAGYSDTEEHTVKLATFNANEVLSPEQTVSFTPLAPAIQTVKPTLYASAGGIKIKITGNSGCSDLAVCILRDEDLGNAQKSVSDIRWKEVTTLFTSSDNITLTRRGIQPVKAVFGVYIRDHWGNVSDTVKAVLTPLEEIQIPKSGFKYADPGDDNCLSLSSESSTYPIKGLWDGSGASAAYKFMALGTCPMPCWLTIDLGVNAELSRIATLPRIAYNIWKDAHPRDFEFWGSMNPTGKAGKGEHGFDDSWFCLGKFTQFKPSGYAEDGSLGTLTAEDNTYFNNGNDFELDNTVYPHAYDQLRYLRIVFVNTFATFELKEATEAAGIQFGEITPYGQIVK